MSKRIEYINKITEQLKLRPGDEDLIRQRREIIAKLNNEEREQMMDARKEEAAAAVLKIESLPEPPPEKVNYQKTAKEILEEIRTRKNIREANGELVAAIVKPDSSLKLRTIARLQNERISCHESRVYEIDGEIESIMKKLSPEEQAYIDNENEKIIAVLNKRKRLLGVAKDDGVQI